MKGETEGKDEETGEGGGKREGGSRGGEERGGIKGERASRAEVRTDRRRAGRGWGWEAEAGTRKGKVGGKVDKRVQALQRGCGCG
jgi:hypothetical protein